MFPSLNARPATDKTYRVTTVGTTLAAVATAQGWDGVAPLKATFVIPAGVTLTLIGGVTLGTGVFPAGSAIRLLILGEILAPSSGVAFSAASDVSVVNNGYIGADITAVSGNAYITWVVQGRIVGAVS